MNTGNDAINALLEAAPQGVKRVAPYQPGKPIEELRREKGFPPDFKIIKLASNENPLGPSPLAIAAMQEAACGVHYYPDSTGFKLRAKLADRLGVDPNGIVLSAGSEYLLDIIMRTFLKPGDELLLSDCSFPIFTICATLQEAKIVLAPVNDDFSHNIDAILERITSSTRMAILASPDNPTGSLLKIDDLWRVYDKLPMGSLLVVDEAYHELVTTAGYVSSLQGSNRLNNGERTIITSRTFSKGYSLAGIRIGYGVMPLQIASFLQRSRLAFIANSVAQVGAIAALDDEAHLRKSASLLAQERPRLAAECRALGFIVVEGHANFILIGTAPHSGQDFSNALLNKGVIVRPLGHPKMREWIRVTVGLPEENDHFLQVASNIR